MSGYSANLLHLFKRQATTASIALVSRMTFFSHHVGDIIRGTPETKMVRVHAGRTVTTVQKDRTTRNWSAQKRPSEAMRFPVFLRTMWTGRKLAITFRISTGEPKPARLSFSDFFPEPNTGINCFTRHAI